MVNEENLKVLDAIFAVKAKFSKLEKDGKNPYFKSNYVTLNQVLDMVVPLFREEGVELLQPVGYVETSSGELRSTLSLVLAHESGESISSVMLIPTVEDIQKLGASITYLRRYMLKSFLGLQDEDDDGETAVGRSGGFGPSKSSKPSKGLGSRKPKQEEPKEEIKEEPKQEEPKEASEESPRRRRRRA